MDTGGKPPSRSSHVRVWNICAAVVVLGLVLSAAVQQSRDRSRGYNAPPGVPSDFPHYYLAGRLARLKPPENLLYYPPTDHTARSILDLRIDATTPYGRPSTWGGLPDGAVRFPYIAPPLVAFLMEPLAFLRWQTAYFVWQVLSALMMAASLYLALRLSLAGPPAMLLIAISIAVGFLFQPFQVEQGGGNINALMFFLWVWGVLLLRRGRALPSAVCFALGTAIKVTPILAVPFLAIRRQWRWLVSYTVANIFLLAISIWRLGWTNHVVWARIVAPVCGVGLKSFYNRSLPGFIFALGDSHTLLEILTGPSRLVLFNKAVSAACFGAFVIWCWKQRRNSQGLVLEMILLPLVILLVSPISWTEYWLFALLPLTYLWTRAREPDAGASQLDLSLLAGATLVLGNSLPFSRLAFVIGAPFELSMMGAWVLATLAIIWVGMRIYKRDTAGAQQALAGLNTSSQRTAESVSLPSAR